MNNPLFSVITPSFNQGRFIRQNIESVLQQDFGTFEHLVMDGGSNDSTVGILKEYPHLQWVSEPDRGQSHALNKGFARATGDYIGWINSDDWYAPGAFREVAPLLAQYPIVMGACEFTDAEGVTKLTVPNVERNWHDLLKYWVYHSSPAQPAIFFRRDILDAIKLPNGDVIDENCHFAMDYDLWLRIGRRHPLVRRTPRTLAYFREHEESKTGTVAALGYAESARLFRRWSSIDTPAEAQITWILPSRGEASALDAWFGGTGPGQFLHRTALLVVDYGDDPAASRKLRSAAMKHAGVHQLLDLRYCHYVGTRDPSLVNAIDFGIEHSQSPYVAYTPGAGPLDPGTAVEAVRSFEMDSLSAMLPARLSGSEGAVSPAAILGHTGGLMPFILRKIAYRDAGGFGNEPDTAAGRSLAFKSLLVRFLHKGWAVMTRQFVDGIDDRTDLGAEDGERISARILVDLEEDLSRDPFAAVRAENGFALRFSEDQLRWAREMVRASSAAPMLARTGGGG